jgi:hypothetical protein
MVLGFGKWAIKEGVKKDVHAVKWELVKKSWQSKRIDAINRKIKNYKGPKPHVADAYVQEAANIYTSEAKTKKAYKRKK